MDSNGTAAFPVVSPAAWADGNWVLVLGAEVLLCVCLWASVCSSVLKRKKVDPKNADPEEQLLKKMPSLRPQTDRAVDGIEFAIAHVQEDMAELKSGGMLKLGFTLGLLNVVLTTVVFGAVPEHLWLIFLAKCFFLIPLWWKTVAELHNGHLFILDFCWCSASCMGVYFALTLAGSLTPGQQKSAFLIFFCAGMGPMAWANLLLGNGITFHAIIDLSSNFIHLTPNLVAVALNAFPHRLAEAWPNRFPSRDAVLACSWSEIYLHGAAFYLTWVVLHGLWLLTIGVKAPDQGYNTVFDWANKKGGWGAMWEKKGVKGVHKHAFLYLVTHCLLSNLAIAIAAVMIKHVLVQFVFVGTLVGAATWSGAGKYQFLIMRKTDRMLQKLLEAEKQKTDHIRESLSEGSVSMYGMEHVGEKESI